MGKITKSLVAFNRGLLSPLALARVDLQRTALSAETQTNWMSRVLGAMSLRPGLFYTGYGTKSNNTAIHIPFVFSTTDTAIIELTGQVMRVKVNEIPITRPTVTSVVTNSTFNTDLVGWTSEDEAGATSSQVAPGYMSLVGTSINSAKRSQLIMVSSTNIEHALRIEVIRGPVTLNVGTTSGDDSYVSATLKTGTHSLSFTPTGNFYIQVSNSRQAASLIDSIAIESAGVMEITTPWIEADLGLIRYDQSADVIFVACRGYQQYRIERRSTTSWSVVLYEPENGPFRVQNLTRTTLTPSAISGDISLTSSKPLFKSTQVGALFNIDSIGQTVALTASGANQWTDPIRVIGISDARKFTINISGTWVGTVTLQRSVATPDSWANVTTYTTNQSNVVYTDGLDNQIIYYRIGIDTGNYTSGSASLNLSYPSGSITGVVRITAFTNSTTVSASVIKNLGGTTASENWAEGAWSSYRGFPSALCLFEGRLYHAGKAYLWGSVSDAYESFDDTIEGDSAPISRTIGSGPVDNVNWLLPLQRLIIGLEGSEKSVRSSSLDEPLTATNLNIKTASTQGTAAIQPAIIDINGIFIQRSGEHLYEMAYNPSGAYTLFDYTANELSTIYPEAGTGGIIRIAVQRQQDTRIHCVRNDGKVAIQVYDKVEDVHAWLMFETDGEVEDAFVLPGDEEDKVYYLVKRTINGSIVRYLERWAMESECIGGTLNKQADSFIIYSGAPTTTIPVPHLEAKDVIVWGDGIDYSPLDTNGDPTTYTVTGGNITLTTAVSNAIIGLHYEAPFKSTKLVYSTDSGATLTQPKRVNYLALVLSNTHSKGIRFGADFDTLEPMPNVEKGEEIAYDYIWGHYDNAAIEFNGTWDTDSRICLKASAPRPATVLAAVIGFMANAKE